MHHFIMVLTSDLPPLSFPTKNTCQNKIAGIFPYCQLTLNSSLLFAKLNCLLKMKKVYKR